MNKSLSEKRLRRGGQAHFAYKASQNEPVPGIEEGDGPRDWVYDLVFLDSDHSYDYLSQEFAHFLPRARLIALHDIVSTHPFCPGARRFWNEIKHQFPHHEFVEQYPGRSGVMGIGLIETERAAFAGSRDESIPRGTSNGTSRSAVTDALLESGAF